MTIMAASRIFSGFSSLPQTLIRSKRRAWRASSAGSDSQGDTKTCRGEFHKNYISRFLDFYIATFFNFYIFKFLPYISGKVAYFKATFPYVIQGQITQNLHNNKVYTDVKSRKEEM